MAAETVELDKDAFMRLVTEEHLQVEGPSEGYLYTGKRGRNGWELYKTWMGVVGWDLMPVISGATANPAAGANPNGFTVPAGKRYLFMGASFSLVTDANVANRTVSGTIAYDGGVIAHTAVISTTAQTASLTRYYSVIAARTYGETYSAALGGYYFLGMGAVGDGLELPPGAVLSLTVLSKQVGDDASATTYWYKEAPA